MLEKLFSRKSRDFYLPGQEIKLDKSFSFSDFSYEKDPLSMCKNRLAFAMLMFALVFGVISFRLFDVCVLNAAPRSEKVASAADDDTFYALPENPIKRADIVDRNGTIIATSLPTVNLYANPSKIINPQRAAQKLAAVLPDIRYEDILAKLTKKGSFVYIKRNLSPSQQYQINYLGIPGLEFEDGEKRIYPHKNLFAQLIGSTNIDNIGISGMEKELDARLRESDIPVKLTIDAGLQDTIRRELDEGIKKFKALGGVAILMDVNTAEVIAMVSLPDYDPNNITAKVDDRALFNFATKGVYEPGSVLKVFNAAFGLEKGHIKLTDRFDATKPLKLRYNTIKDYRGENRWLTLQEILIYSSNIGSAQIALKIGKEKQRAFLKKLGLFDEISHFEVAEKAKPMLPRRWGEETTATVAYGYGISITPLHLITAFSAVVNGGVYHEPTLLANDTNREEHRVISLNTSKKMRQLLRGVVVEGSGKRANVLGYEVAGKTGTAQKLVNGKYINKKVMTSFLGTFPASNPKYALMLMLDEPKGSKETWGFVTSGWNTVPTAGKIITAIAPQLNIKANYDLDELRRNRIIEASYER